MALVDTAIKCLVRFCAIHTGRYLGGKLDETLEKSRQKASV